MNLNLQCIWLMHWTKAGASLILVILKALFINTAANKSFSISLLTLKMHLKKTWIQSMTILSMSCKEIVILTQMKAY